MGPRATQRVAPWLLLSATLLVAAAGQRAPDLQVLHVNDIHAHYDPSDVNFGTTCDLDNGAPTCFGGVARLDTAIAEAKAEAAAAGMDTLVLHAGDQFTGTLWDVVYTSNGYLIAAPFLQELGVQAFTFGNHEFDHGPGLAAQFAANLTELGIPVLACNMDVSQEPAFDGVELQNFTIVELPKSKAKVGIIGLTTTDTVFTSSPGRNIVFRNYTDALPGCVAAAKAAGAERIIALTHIGYDEDLSLAADAAAAGVGLIVGGHSHTLLYGAPAPAGEPQVASTPPPLLVLPATNESNTAEGPYPTLVKAADGRSLPVVQALWGSRYMGKLATAWDAEGGLVAANGTVVLLGGANSTNYVPEDPDVTQQLNNLRGALNELNSQILGTSLVFLDGDRVDVRSNETNLGDFVCDALYWYISSTGSGSGGGDVLDAYPGVPAVCLMSGGSLRVSIPPGNVSYGNVLDVLPFGNFLVVKKVDASIMTAALNNGLSGWTGDSSGAGRFPQVGGLRYSFNPELPEDSRLVNAELLPSGGGSPVPLASYTGDILLLTADYNANGGDNYTMFEAAPLVYDSSTLLASIVSDYVTATSPIDIAAQDRIINCAQNATNALCTAAAAAPAPAPASAAMAAGWGGLARLGAAAVVVIALLI